MLQKFRKSRNHGFTLAEMLVTIAIIGILAAIVTIGFDEVQEQARDSERQADVVTIMNALEKYYDEHGEYPANDVINPTNSPTELPDFNGVKSLMPGLTDEDLTGPGGYTFYAGCINTECNNTSEYWRDYHAEQYYYVSRFLVQTTQGGMVWFETGSSYGDGTGWGCRMETTYAEPGYVLAWRREQDGVWVFKRSIHGNVTIEVSGSGGPVPPQTCEFS